MVPRAGHRDSIPVLPSRSSVTSCVTMARDNGARDNGTGILSHLAHPALTAEANSVTASPSFCHALLSRFRHVMGRERRRASSSLAPPTSLQDDNGGRQWGGATATLRPLPASSQKRSAEPSLSLQSPSRLLDLGVSSLEENRIPNAGKVHFPQLREPKRHAFPRSRQTGRLALRTRSRPVLQHIRKTQADARIARPGLQPSAHPLALSTSTPSRARIPILRPSRTARPALPSRARRVPVPCPFARSRSRRTVP